MSLVCIHWSHLYQVRKRTHSIDPHRCQSNGLNNRHTHHKDPLSLITASWAAMMCSSCHCHTFVLNSVYLQWIIIALVLFSHRSGITRITAQHWSEQRITLLSTLGVSVRSIVLEKFPTALRLWQPDSQGRPTKAGSDITMVHYGVFGFWLCDGLSTALRGALQIERLSLIFCLMSSTASRPFPQRRWARFLTGSAGLLGHALRWVTALHGWIHKSDLFSNNVSSKDWQ